MEELTFSHLTCDQLVERIATSLENSLNPEESAYAMLLGSGFSFPLVPTGREMVESDIAWWTYATRKRLDYFAPCPPEHNDALTEHARELWSSALRERADDPALFELDGSTGLPRLTGDNITNAYLAVMSAHCVRGLSSPRRRRAYFRDACTRIERKVNLSHLYLGSLLHEQTTARWRDSGMGIFVKNIFTTNFDQLLQRAAQLHNVLYFMTDQPEGGIEAPDDTVDHAVHFVYTHGSIHRRFLANNDAEISRMQGQNSASPEHPWTATRAEQQRSGFEKIASSK